METPKYELIGPIKQGRSSGDVIYQIRALRDIRIPYPNNPDTFLNVRSGDLGGWVQDGNTLAQSGDCWVEEHSMALGYSTRVRGNAVLCNNSTLTNACITGDVHINGGSRLEGVRVYGKTHITCSRISSKSLIIDGDHTIEGVCLYFGGYLLGDGLITTDTGYVHTDATMQMARSALITCFLNKQDAVTVSTNYALNRVIESSKLDAVIEGFDLPVWKTTTGDTVLNGDSVKLVKALKKLANEGVTIFPSADSLYPVMKHFVNASVHALRGSDDL